MRISPDEMLAIYHNFKSVAHDAQQTERTRAANILHEAQQDLRAKVNQICTELVEESGKWEKGTGVPDLLMDTATKIRDLLDDRPDPESDPDNAKRFPSMYRGGPVECAK